MNSKAYGFGRQFVRTMLAASMLASGLIGESNVAHASSHREAPFVTEHPKVDGTDFYMFMSYEQGRSDYVTMIADYLPLQDSYGGPNYFSLDPDAVYEIHVDNSGDAKEDLTFQFKFKSALQDLALQIGDKKVSVPLINIGQIGPEKEGVSSLNIQDTYTVTAIRGDRRKGKRSAVTDLATGSKVFRKPVDNIGNKSIPNYESYARKHIYDISVPGCAIPGKVFAGQRSEPFSVNLGEAFDLVNLNPLGPVDDRQNIIADKNVTSLALEIHKSCLTKNGSTIAAWTTASLPENGMLRAKPNFARPERQSGELVQVSRLANPLVNELVIGLKDKDKFNNSAPKDDPQFLTYVTNPTLPALLEVLFGVRAPTSLPRNDLVSVFLTGVEGLNKTSGVGEMMRLNTSIAPVAAAQQNNLGVIGGDTAGYPNGRRLGDDVVDISLRVVMGKLLDASSAPDGQLAYTDGATVNASMFGSTFPYANAPLAGAVTASTKK